MKKHILSITLLLLIALQACKKDNQTNHGSEEKKYDVQFNVKGFEQVIEPATSVKNKKRIAADPSLMDYYLLCLYYKQDGTLVASKASLFYEDDYGVFNTKLAAGNYTVIIFAYGDYNYFSVRDGEIFYDEYEFGDPSFRPLRDIYSKRVNFSVGGDTNNVVQDVILQRYFGALAIQITDALPANTISIETSVKDRAGINIFNDVTVANSNVVEIQTIKQLTGQAGVTNYLLNTDLKIFSTSEPTEVIITARGTGGIITRKVIPNVNFYKNTKTILRGKLFESNQTGNNAGFSTSFETFLPDSITAQF